ncbi:MAG: hypothetical protein J6J35_01340 [Alphaproteobacteria bacterium]|nr:hypothetical protein [Alphaproteobacteria bacterium]MBP3686990.1 hypothetical protein [Alphaproteobacteria bacterium]
MKNPKFIMLAVLAVFMVTSCSRPANEKELNNNLTAFTFTTDDGKTLTGIKNKETNESVIEPVESSSVMTDKHVIVITDTHERKHVYTLEGIKLGLFDNWTHWIAEDRNYYHGTNYNKNCYYFPDKKLFCKATSAYCAANTLLLEKNNCWQVIDFQGNTLSTLKKPFWIVKSLQKRDGEKLFIVRKQGVGYAITHIDGSNPKKVSKSAWKKIEKSLTNLEKKSNGVIYAETDKL